MSADEVIAVLALLLAVGIPAAVWFGMQIGWHRGMDEAIARQRQVARLVRETRRDSAETLD